MKVKRIILMTVLLIIVVVSVGGQTKEIGKQKEIDGITYKVYSEKEAIVVDGCRNKKEVTIPESVNIRGKIYKVTVIGLCAFKGKNEIVRLSIPSSVTSIEPFAFAGCASLQNIDIPNSISSIREHTFEGCTSLQSVYIPNSVTSIIGHAFAGCISLRSIDIPNSVVSIGSFAFEGCTSLQSVYIPNSVTSIGEAAFNNCEALKMITVPDNSVALVNMFYERSTLNDEIIFCNCNKISTVRGNTILYPEYIYGELPMFCPFIKQQLPLIKKTFSYYAYDKVKNRITEWQQKKEYETTAQWRERVTDITRKQKLLEIIEQVRKEYIAERVPIELKGELGTFDADYEAFPVKVEGLNTFYAQVPLSDASAFKDNWNNIVLQPQYGVVDDNLGILSCTFKLGNKIYQSAKKYSNDNSANLAINLSPLEIELNIGQKTSFNDNLSSVPLVVDREVDSNIPVTSTMNTKTFAVVIGNENYQRASKVSYALNDAQIFAAYCQKTLGIPINNIRRYKDATYGTMLSALKDIKNIANAYNGDISIIFYYAGHGVPNEANKNAYLLPIDADGTQPEVCLAASRLYQELEALHVRSVVVFMDACFSGAQRGEGMLASARGVALKVNTEVPQGNIVVFSAASGDETAFPYKEKGHGMFTYFLLKKLQESKGEVALGELGDYITTNVKQQSVVVNHKSQTPTVVSSVSLRGNWETMRLR